METLVKMYITYVFFFFFFFFFFFLLKYQFRNCNTCHYNLRSFYPHVAIENTPTVLAVEGQIPLSTCCLSCIWFHSLIIDRQLDKRQLHAAARSSAVS